MASLGSRIKQAADNIGGLDALAERLSGVKRRTLSDWVSDKTEPRASSLAEICDVCDVGVDWLVTGAGEFVQLDRSLPGGADFPDVRGISIARRPADLSATMQTQGRANRLDTEPDLVTLPEFDIQASAGLGVPVGPEIHLGAIAFDRRFLRDRGAHPDHCSIITASGDSMQPAIPDGSLLIVDHSQTEVKNGLIMVINVGDDLLVKRIRRRLDGLIELISDNPAYAPETLGPDAMQQLRIVGRVVYFCRTP